MTSNDAMNEANRRYYNNEMLVRRVRIVSEIDIEWREDEPDYCLDVARCDAHLPTSARMVRPAQVNVEIIGEPREVGNDE